MSTRRTRRRPSDGHGVVFRARTKRTDTSPDYTGELQVGDETYDVVGWQRTARTGDPYVSLSLTKRPEPAEDRRAGR